MNPHSVDVQRKVVGLYNSQALGVIPSAYQFGRVSTDDRPKPIQPPTKAKIMTVQKEEKAKKNLLKKQKEVGKREAQASPSVDIASQQQFSEATSEPPGGVRGGRKKAVKMIPTGVTQHELTLGSSAKGGKKASKKAGSARGGELECAGSAKGGAKSAWMVALQQWNASQPKYTIPKKGTKQYDEVRALMK